MTKFVHEHNYNDRPQPTTNGRFEIQRDDFVRQKLSFIKQGFEIAQKIYPEMIGLVVYGSYTKGTASEESDVDCYLFINPELALMRNPETDVITSRGFNRGEVYYTSHFNKDISYDYSHQFHKEVFSSMDRTENPLELKIQTFTVPISAEIIDFHINKHLEFIFTLIDYNEKMLTKEHLDPNIAVPIKPTNVGFGINIPAMFHLQVGHGLNMHRKYVIDQLMQIETERGCGNLIWRVILAEIKRYEMLGLKNPKRFPETLEQAKTIYFRS